MFGQDTVAACCANTSGVASARLPANSVRAASGREINFPMASPFGPMRRADIPVDARLGRLARRRGHGMGGFYTPLVPMSSGYGPDPWDPDWIDPPVIDVSSGPIVGPGVSLPPVQNGSNEPSTLETILRGITGILPSVPAVISAATQNPYYNPAQVAQAQRPQTVYSAPVGSTGAVTTQTGGAGTQTGAVVGGLFDSIGRIITENPGLTLALGAGAVLLFMRPPSRR